MEKKPQCISSAFPAPLPHRDQPATHTTKTDNRSQKSANLRAVGAGLTAPQKGTR
jgi:hypothetical protein